MRLMPTPASPVRLIPQMPPRQGQSGTSTGVNTAPGSDDDGWIVPEPVTLADGTILQLLKDGEALHVAYRSIESARRRICMEFYTFASDDTGRAFADLLCRKAREGVKIYLIYDSFGCVDTDESIFNDMRRAGVRLAEFNPLKPWRCKFSWRPYNRDHRKMIVIDDEIGGLGGLNLGANYAGSWVVRDSKCVDLWRDTAIGMRGPSVKLLLRAFHGSWRYVHQGGRVRKAEFVYGLDAMDADPQDPPAEMALIACVPTRSSPLRPLLKKLFLNARDSIDLTMAYFAPDDDLVQNLCKASRRGVRVRLMLPGRSDVPVLQLAARSFYETLLAAGVQIFERRDVVLHSKTMVIDQNTSLIGSTNLDYRSIEYNLEVSVLVKSNQLGTQMRTLFEHDVQFSDRIDLGQWRKRHFTDRFVQWAVSRARYLL